MSNPLPNPQHPDRPAPDRDCSANACDRPAPDRPAPDRRRYSTHRRRFNTALAAGAAALAWGHRPGSDPLFAPSLAQSPSPSLSLDRTSLPSLSWQMATSWPKSLEVVFGGSTRICQRVGELTQGRFSITPYESGELTAGLDVLAAVADGTVACGHTASYYYVKTQPALAFATTVPFGLNAAQQDAWLYGAGGLELMQEIYAELGVINFAAGNTGAQMGGWFKQPIATPADLQGLKMRIPGLGGEVMKRLGVDVQSLVGTEIFAALEQGTIDAAEWVGPYEDEKLGLSRVAGIYYYPGWWEPGTTYELQVNLQQWQQLPLEYQQALYVATLETHQLMVAEYDAVNREALQRLILGGTQVQAYEPEILAAAQQATLEFYTEQSQGDQTFKRVYEQWRQFQTQTHNWQRTSEFALMAYTAQKVATKQDLGV